MARRRFYRSEFDATLVARLAATIFWMATTTMTTRADPTTTTTTADDPRAAIDAFLAAVAKADAAAVERGVAATNADEAALRPALAAAAAAVGGFEGELVRRFGAAAARAATRPAADDAATLRQDGVWRLTFAGVAAAMRGRGFELFVPSDEPARRLVEMRGALDAVTLDVRAGRYPTAAAASDAARQAWNDAARGAQAQ